MAQALEVHSNPVDAALHNVMQYLDREDDYLDAAILPVSGDLRESSAFNKLWDDLQIQSRENGGINTDDMRWFGALMFLAGREAKQFVPA
jgi:hypothetical protein